MDSPSSTSQFSLREASMLVSMQIQIYKKKKKNEKKINERATDDHKIRQASRRERNSVVEMGTEMKKG